jgi:hypothetical protein
VKKSKIFFYAALPKRHGDSSSHVFHDLADFSKLIDKVVYVKGLEHEKTTSSDDGELKIEMTKSFLQKDPCSCFLFALDHSDVVSSYETQKLIEKSKPQTESESESNKLFYLEWTDLPPAFIKNAQSSAVINHYNTVTKSTVEKTGGLDITKTKFKKMLIPYEINTPEIERRIKETGAKTSLVDNCISFKQKYKHTLDRPSSGTCALTQKFQIIH